MFKYVRFCDEVVLYIIAFEREVSTTHTELFKVDC